MTHRLKLGRLPRARNPRVPHMSALLAGKTLAPPPPSADWTARLPADLGQMLNDQLGDCTCAAVYHAIQVWSGNTGHIVTCPDPDVLALYEAACGYVEGDASTDQGGVEQNVLGYWLKNGAPTWPTTAPPQKLAAFVEVDPRNLDDVKRTIAECGVAYIGFDVPSYLMASGPPDVWDVQSNNAGIEGGHAVVLAGYDDKTATVISWGRLYKMTWPFFSAFTDEVYALADADWAEATGMTPAGMTLTDLEAQMKALAE